MRAVRDVWSLHCGNTCGERLPLSGGVERERFLWKEVASSGQHLAEEGSMFQVEGAMQVRYGSLNKRGLSWGHESSCRVAE